MSKKAECSFKSLLKDDTTPIREQAGRAVCTGQQLKLSVCFEASKSFDI